MEKAVKGATKIKLAAPKSKYVAAILSATAGGDAGVAEVFRTLQLRLRDSTWTIVFKSLIIVHLMIRDGEADVTLKYIAESPKRLAISTFTEVQTQGPNIRRYSEFLLERVRGYRDTKVDFVRAGAGKLKRLTVDKGLLRETEAVQNQIRALLKCDMLGQHDPDNEITLTAFRLLTMDLLELFTVMNEGTINVLEHYFEMSRPDAERSLNIYKTFGRQTDQVVQYLSLARQYETSTRLEVPKLKHAPTTLTSSLEEYLNDPDFEVNRRQYLAQQQAKKNGKPSSGSRMASAPPQPPKADTSFPAPTTTAQAQQPKGPAPDLIDFFESIEQNQQPMAQQPSSAQDFPAGFPQMQQYQQSAFQPQPPASAQELPAGYPQAQQYQQSPFQPQQSGYNPFLQQSAAVQIHRPLQPAFNGAGFGGYTPQPLQHQHQQAQPYAFQPQLTSIPQNGVADFQDQTSFQPPRQSIVPQQTSTNPFRQSVVSTNAPAPAFHSPVSQLNRQSTNPFAKNNGYAQPQQMGTGFFDSNTATQFPSLASQTQSHDLATSPPFFSSQTSAPQSQQSQFASPTTSPQKTGTNPFAKNRSPPNAISPLVASPTGSTNPFRQSAFVNSQTGQGWQHSNQGTFLGFDVNSVETVPVFPRPGHG